MAKRKDSKKRILKPGEGVRIKDGKETYYYRWTDITGKRRYIYSVDLNKLRKRENQIKADEICGIRSAENVTVNDVYSMWLKIKRGLKSNTLSTYKYTYEHYVYPTIGKKKISVITKMNIRLFYIELVEKQNLKIGTVERIHNILYQVFNLAVEQNYIKDNACSDALTELKKTHDHTEKRIALTIEEQKLFEKCLLEKENIYYSSIFLVMMYCGLRVGEATGLRWCDIDFSNNLISVNHTLVYYKGNETNSYIYSINTPKTKKSYRTVPMIKKVSDSLQKLKEFQNDNQLKCLTTVDGYCDFIFINRYGTVMERSGLNTILSRIVRQCNLKQIENIESKESKELVLLPHITCHILRHTAATRLFESGVNSRFVMDMLGHTDIRTTMNVYVDVTKKFQKEEVSKFESYMEDDK